VIGVGVSDGRASEAAAAAAALQAKVGT
jgi:hypothetical protein